MKHDGTYEQNTNPATHEGGFYVGLLRNEHVIILQERHAERLTLLQLINLACGAYVLGRDALISIWTHAGNTYIEPSQWVQTWQEAYTLAKETGQIAVWHIASGTPVTVEQLTEWRKRISEPCRLA